MSRIEWTDKLLVSIDVEDGVEVGGEVGGDEVGGVVVDVDGDDNISVPFCT